MSRRADSALVLGAALLTAMLEFTINPRLFATPGVNTLIDSWIYTGYFLSLPSFVHRFPGTYYGSRLSVILPGSAAHALFTPSIANYVLHVALLCALLLSTHALVRHGSNRRTAWLVTLVMAWNPVILSSVSWDYVDGFGMVFLVGALLCLERASAGAGRWRFYAGAAGAVIGCLVTANLFLLVLLPVLALFLVLRTGRSRWRVAAGVTVLAAVGAVAMLACFGATSAALGGSFWFLQPQLHAATTLTAARNPWQLSGYVWLASATWLVLPLIASVGAAFELARWLRARLPLTFEITLQIVLLSAAVMWLAIQVFSTPVLQISYYSSYLAPLALLALPLQSDVHAALGRTRLVALAAATVALFAIGHWLMLSDVPWFWASTQPAWIYRILSRAPWIGPVHARECIATGIALAAGGLAVASLQLRGPATRRWLLFCAGLTMSYTAAPQLWPKPDDAGAARYEETVAAHRFIGERIDGRIVRFWYSLAPDSRRPVRSLASTYLWGYTLVNETFPLLTHEQASTLSAGTRLVLLVPSANDAQLARDPLRGYGWDFDVLAHQDFGAGALAMSVVIGDVSAARPLARSSSIER